MRCDKMFETKGETPLLEEFVTSGATIIQLERRCNSHAQVVVGGIKLPNLHHSSIRELGEYLLRLAACYEN